MKKIIIIIIIIFLAIIGVLVFSIHENSVAARRRLDLEARQLKKPELTVKIIEGQTAKQMAAYLQEDKLLSDDQFLKLATAPIKDLPGDLANYVFLQDAPRDATLEGYLFPDTYRVFKTATGADLIKKMLDNFDRKLTGEMRAEITKQNKSIYDIVTMASIVQKEVRSNADMKLVAGIFYNRMNAKIALQSCATLAYILGVNKMQYSYEDTKIASPYNTYQHRGLPPGPIANPGQEALIAAIYPTPSNYLYFLSDPASGNTIFSKTLDEHNANKAKYLK